VKEINSKFLQEIELARHKLEVLREEKGDSEMECLDKLRWGFERCKRMKCNAVLCCYVARWW
jgi:hypothetical protein